MTRTILEPILLLTATVPVAALAIAWGAFGYPVHAIAWHLSAGWVSVGLRALAQVDWNLAGIATGFACSAAVVAALHYFGAWFYREVRAKQERADWPPAWRWRWTFSLTAAVMLMFVAGLAGVGLFRTTSWFLETPVMFTNANSLSIQ